jgi:hypothetical protein
MTGALSVTGRDLIRALGDVAALPSVDDAVRARAETVGRRLAGGQAITRMLRRGLGHYSVEVTGADLFAREFGSQGADAVPTIGGEGQP